MTACNFIQLRKWGPFVREAEILISNRKKSEKKRQVE